MRPSNGRASDSRKAESWFADSRANQSNRESDAPLEDRKAVHAPKLGVRGTAIFSRAKICFGIDGALDALVVVHHANAQYVRGTQHLPHRCRPRPRPTPMESSALGSARLKSARVRFGDTAMQRGRCGGQQKCRGGDGDPVA